MIAAAFAEPLNCTAFRATIFHASCRIGNDRDSLDAIEMAVNHREDYRSDISENSGA